MRHRNFCSFLTLALLLGVSACNSKKKSSSSSSSTSNFSLTTTGSSTGGTTTGGFTTGSSTGGTTTGSTSAGTTGGTTTGTVTGGSSSAYSIDVAMSGNGTSCESVNPSTPCDSWFMGMVPTNTSGVQVGEFIPVSANNVGFIAADSYYKIRATVLPQPNVSNTTNSPYCWGRNYPQSQSPLYTKLRFIMGIREVTSTGSGYSIGPRFANVSSGVLNVDAKLIFDFSTRLNSNNPSIVGYAVDISDVQSDSNCMGTSAQCVTSLVKSGSCWNVRLEIATDNNPVF